MCVNEKERMKEREHKKVRICERVRVRVRERIKERYLVSACMWDSAIVQLYRKSKKISLVEVITFKQTSCLVSKCQLSLDDITLSRIFR